MFNYADEWVCVSLNTYLLYAGMLVFAATVLWPLQGNVIIFIYIYSLLLQVSYDRHITEILYIQLSTKKHLKSKITPNI